MSEELQPVTHLTTRRVKGPPTLKDMWANFVSLQGDISQSTLIMYGQVGRKFCSFMEGKQITPEAVADYVRWLQASGTMSGRTINHRNVRVRAFLRHLHKTGHLRHDISEYVFIVKEEAQKPAQIFTDQEYEAMKAWCSTRPQYSAYLWLIILSYRTGMSLVDCCHLRWKDVTLNENGPSHIDIYRIKLVRHGEKALCQIPIVAGTDVHQWLVRMHKSRHLNYKRNDGIDDYVNQDCPGIYGSFAVAGQVRCKFKEIARRAGVKRNGRTFRHLRNTFCSNLVNSGAQLALVCKMTGHQNVETLLGYLKINRTSMSDELQKSFQHAAAESRTIVTGTGIKLEP